MSSQCVDLRDRRRCPSRRGEHRLTGGVEDLKRGIGEHAGDAEIRESGTDSANEDLVWLRSGYDEAGHVRVSAGAGLRAAGDVEHPTGKALSGRRDYKVSARLKHAASAGYAQPDGRCVATK